MTYLVLFPHVNSSIISLHGKLLLVCPIHRECQWETTWDCAINLLWSAFLISVIEI
jgi:hypothetical protein